MATTKYKDAQVDVIQSIADELGISKAQLNGMDLEQVRALVESVDLDPAIKAKLVRSKLRQLREILDITDAALAGTVNEETTESAPAPKGKGSDDTKSNGKSRAA